MEANMAFSVNSPIGDGVTTQFAVSFTNGLYSRDNVHVFVGDETTERAFTWINDGLIDVQGTVPAVGEVVTIRRIMDKTNKAVDFADGEILDERNLDTMVDQLYNIAHEFLDGYGLTEVNVDINMRGNSLTNVSTDPNDPNSIATVGYTSGAVAAAEASEAAAAASEAAAAASASSAGSSQASALGYYEDFVSSFYGELASDPTQNPLGDPVKAGDMYFNTTLSEMRLYSGTDWQPVLDAVSTLVDSQEFTNAAGQTTFTMDYNTTAVQVYYNGVLLSPTDYTANTGTEIVLATPVASDDDIVSVQAWSNINVADQAGFRTELDVYSKAEVQEVTQSNANIIINGDFQVWQRGTSFTTPDVDSVYTADRWLCDMDTSSSDSGTISRQAFTLGQTDVPAFPNNYFRYDCTTGLAGNATMIRQRVEDVSEWGGQTFTLSYYAKADSAITTRVQAITKYGDGSASPNNTALDVDITLSTSWQKFEHTFTTESSTGKDIQNNSYLEIAFIELTSSGNGSFVFDLANVKLELGTVATPFEKEPYGDVLAKCQRYYFRQGTNWLVHREYRSTAAAVVTYRLTGYLPTTMRIDNQTVTLLNTSSENITTFPYIDARRRNSISFNYVPNNVGGLYGFRMGIAVDAEL